MIIIIVLQMMVVVVVVFDVVDVNGCSDVDRNLNDPLTCASERFIC